MDSETLDLYLQKLEVFLYDEDKIVTFKWLSSNLGISVNDSKRILKQYIHDNRNVKTHTLAITYVLSGILEDNTLSISIVKESELDQKKNQLASILSEEIYSVQKSNNVDLNIVGLVDHFSINNVEEVPIIGSILSKNCFKRKIKKKILPEPPPPTLKGKISIFTKVPPKTTNNTNLQDAQQKQDITEPKNNTDSNSKSSSTTNVELKPKTNGIISYFSKNGGVNSKVKTVEKENTKIEDNVVQEVSESKNRYLNIVDSDSDTEKSELKSQTTTIAKHTKSIKKSKNNKKRKCSNQKENSSSTKRRKRILELEESDDDIFENDEINQCSEDVVYESEDEEKPVVKITPSVPKNRKRKLIDATFEDEEGYIITRKQWVEDSASEEEVDVAQNSKPKQQEVPVEKLKSNESNKSDSNTKNKKNTKTNGAKGKKGVVTNQPTLINFFKKK